MNTTKTYGGWTTYETWIVKLWMDEDEGSYTYWNEQAEQAYAEAEADSVFTRIERATYDLADILEIEVKDGVPDLGDCIYGDLLSAALSQVNWSEIAASLIEEVDKAEAIER